MSYVKQIIVLRVRSNINITKNNYCYQMMI